MSNTLGAALWPSARRGSPDSVRRGSPDPAEGPTAGLPHGLQTAAASHRLVCVRETFGHALWLGQETGHNGGDRPQRRFGAGLLTLFGAGLLTPPRVPTAGLPHGLQTCIGESSPGVGSGDLRSRPVARSGDRPQRRRPATTAETGHNGGDRPQLCFLTLFGAGLLTPPRVPTAGLPHGLQTCIGESSPGVRSGDLRSRPVARSGDRPQRRRPATTAVRRGSPDPAEGPTAGLPHGLQTCIGESSPGVRSGDLRSRPVARSGDRPQRGGVDTDGQETGHNGGDRPQRRFGTGLLAGSARVS